MCNKINKLMFFLFVLLVAIAFLPQVSATDEPIPVKVSYPSIVNIATLDFSPDENFLVIGDYSGYVLIWNLETGEDISDPNNVTEKERLVSLLGKHDRTHVHSVKFSPDGKYVLTGGTLFDFESYTKEHRKRENPGISISDIYLWDFETGEYLKYEMKNNVVRNVAFSPDGKYFAASYYNNISSGTNVVKIWSISSQASASFLESNNEEVSSLVFTPDGHYLAVNYYNEKTSSETIFWDWKNETPSFSVNTGSLEEIQFSDDGNIFAGRSRSTNSIKVFNSTNGNLYRDFKKYGMDEYFVSYDLSPDGKYVAVVYGGNMVVWDVDNEEKIADFSMSSNAYWLDCVSFSPNMTYLANGGDLSESSEYYRSAEKAFSNAYEDGIYFEVYSTMLKSDAVFLWDFQDIKENEYIEDTLDTLFYIIRIAFVVTSIMVLFIILFVAPKRRKKLEE
ncbi:WD40 repeat domain-containing protein [Methanolobus profundi]|uniref:WD40 repeat n=1 Tax=Methanolobus profundi TaxID=487685 RepID=A0A1I4U7P2_9EURY|nr:hypothetical protein [Methanolobus profundi]SFM84994.1 WD40 repeat [Methanolobus profundi]